MFMGWHRTRSTDLLDTLAIFDAIAPQWRFVNDDHLIRRATLITSHLDYLQRGFDADVELWICVQDETEAANLQATLDFEEFGHAVWDDERQVHIGNRLIPVPGYVIAQ